MRMAIHRAPTEPASIRLAQCASVPVMTGPPCFPRGRHAQALGFPAKIAAAPSRQSAVCPKQRPVPANPEARAAVRGWRPAKSALNDVAARGPAEALDAAAHGDRPLQTPTVQPPRATPSPALVS